MMRNAAYATLLTNDSYLAGALVLEHSLREVGSKYPLVVMVTPQLSEAAKTVLTKANIATVGVEALSPAEGAHKLSDADTRFHDTWTKLRAFELIQYDRVVLLDSDMLVLRNMDELIDELDLPPDWIAASHVCACNPRKFPHYPADWIPANCPHTAATRSNGIAYPPQITDSSPRTYGLLNSGLVVLHPSQELATGIPYYVATSPLVSTFSFPDQDLLAHYFRGKLKPLPYIYNALKTLRVVHKPLWRDEEVKCLHYILHDKPWRHRPGDGGDFDEVNRWWWQRFDRVQEQLEKEDPEGWKLVVKQVAPV